LNRTTIWFAGFVLGVTSVAFGQQARPAPQFPEDALVVNQLIDWSRLQTPQPAPEPMPPRDSRVPQPGQDGKQTRPADPQPSEERSPTARLFSGKIIKDGNKFVLKAAGGTFALKQEENLPPYENQDVKVIGSLDSASDTILIVRID
jgi:hypothetical protein